MSDDEEYPYDDLVGDAPPEEEVRFWALWRSDITRLAEWWGTDIWSLPLPKRVAVFAHLLTIPGVLAVGPYRAASAGNPRGGLYKIGSRLLFLLNYVLFSCELPPTLRAGPGLIIPHPVGVGVSGDVRMGSRVTLFRLAAIGGAPEMGAHGKGGVPRIGDDVWVLDSAVLGGRITVGNKSVIGPGAAVNRDVPPGSFVFGPKGTRATVPVNKVIPKRILDATDETKRVRATERARRSGEAEA